MKGLFSDQGRDGTSAFSMVHRPVIHTKRMYKASQHNFLNDVMAKDTFNVEPQRTPDQRENAEHVIVCRHRYETDPGVCHIRPFSITQIISARRTVERRWAITTVVLLYINVSKTFGWHARFQHQEHLWLRPTKNGRILQKGSGNRDALPLSP